MTERRARGAGSLSQRKDGLWVFLVDIGRSPDRKRRRRAFYGRTPEAAEAKARAAFPELRAHDDHAPTTVRAERMRQARALGTHTRREWRDKMRAYDYRCHYCQRDTRHPRIGLHKDHLTPVSRGGSDAIDNVVPACIRCNYDKADMTEAEYALLIGRAA